jgi:hypothetical protein
MALSNPLTSGGGQLVIAQIESTNFSLSGKTGWAILQNGDAYFFNITAEGTITGSTFDGTDFIINQSGAFFYASTPANGNLIASIASASGTDGFSNAYAEGIVSYASATTYVQTLAGFIAFAQASNPAAASLGSNSSASLVVSSGQTSTDNVECILTLAPGDVTSFTPAQAQLVNSVLWIEPLGSSGYYPVSASATAVQIVPLIDGHLQYLSLTTGGGGDGNVYDMGRLSLIAAGQNFTTAAAVAITGLSCHVTASQYRINGMLRCKQTTAVVADILGFNGGTATITSAEIQADNFEIGAGESIYGNILTTLTTVSTNAYGISDSYRWIISGTITFATAGTFTLTGACTANGDDWGIAAGSWLDVLPVA